MSRRLLKILPVTLLCPILFSADAWGQFKESAFSQSYNDENDTTARDSTDAAFTFKEFFGGASHKRDARIGVMFAGSSVFVGTQQIYNRQYWKLPVIYGGMAATAGAGIYFRHKYNVEGDKRFRTASNLCFLGTGLVYWGSLLDGVANYDRGEYPQPGKATLYALLLPGLGQAYNKEYWKIPIYYTALMTSAHFFVLNNTNYRRFRWIYNEATMENSTYDGPVQASTAKYYRDVFRRYRDYAAVAVLGFYVLQIVDANVFAYMHDFELTDDLSMDIAPAVVAPDNYYASAASGFDAGGVRTRPMTTGCSGVGLRIGLRF